MYRFANAYWIIPGNAVLAEDAIANNAPVIPLDAVKNDMKGFTRLIAKLLSSE